MSELIQVESANVSEALDMDKAKEVGDTLSRTYPGYLWIVTVQGGVLVVKNGEIEMSSTITRIQKAHGFVIKHKDSFSATDLAKQAVMAGGEILERAGMPRRKWDGLVPDKLDVS